jgi:hypothetical protein
MASDYFRLVVHSVTFHQHDAREGDSRQKLRGLLRTERQNTIDTHSDMCIRHTIVYNNWFREHILCKLAHHHNR